MTSEVQTTFVATPTTASNANSSTSSNSNKQQQQQQHLKKPFQSQIMRPTGKRSIGTTSPLLALDRVQDTGKQARLLEAQQSFPSRLSTRSDIMVNNNHLNSQMASLQASVVASQEANENGNPNKAEAFAGDNDDSDDKHHVGPVMGIFFKVWSLVKVTKVRNQQKMRRQNSEDTSQFQYIPGSQLAAQVRPAGHEGRHFRRAGSQPASSSSSSGRTSEQFAGATGRYQQLQPICAPATTGTSSTSSGVSSAASSCLATEAQPVSAVKRHLSAYSLRARSGASSAITDGSRSPSAGGSRQVVAQQGGSSKLVESKATSWAAKIRRSATTVNQTDLASYASRYRFRRSNQPPALGASGSGGRLVAGSHSEERTTGSDEEAQRAGARTPTPSYPAEVGDEEGEEDGNSNDIYSTPNDSIQSVPNSVVAPFSGDLTRSNQMNNALAGNQAYPIVKSFSTTNFNQLLKQHSRGAHKTDQTSNQQQIPFETIDERLASRTGAPATAPITYEQFQRQDSSQSGSTTRRLNGSRFFISSSSSEDSNHSPASQQQQQQQQQLLQDQHCQLLSREHPPPSMQPPERQQSTAVSLEQDSRQVPLQLGVHYHAPAFRPDSLVFGGSPSGQVNVLMPVSLFTPISNAPLGMHPSVMSPLAPSHPTSYLQPIAYRKSPSLMEIANGTRLGQANSQHLSYKPFSTKPMALNSTFKPTFDNDSSSGFVKRPTQHSALPNSISLHNCNLNSHKQAPLQQVGVEERREEEEQDGEEEDSEYKLAQMLLKFNSNPKIKDQHGCTALMHAVLSDNLSVIKCLIENGADLNDINQAGFSALDLVCIQTPTASRLEILKFLIDKRANLDQCSEKDGTRLLDRLIAQHQPNNDKLPFIDCLLQNGAKLGSSTWFAASGKYEIQLRLLKKLCQDGYFLYKKSSIEAAVYRFEYALRRIAELEQQLSGDTCRHAANILLAVSQQSILLSARQIKYQTYLGLSRCERKRKFYKRAMEFAHMAILVDSTSYEGYYSKAHILKDLGEIDDSLIAIDQTSRLVEKSIESVHQELETLHQQEEALIFDGCFDLLDKRKPSWFEATRLELSSNLDYLEEAKKFILRLKGEILDDKLKVQRHDNLENQNGTIFSASTPIAT